MTVFDLGGRRPVLPQADQYWIAPDATVIGRVTLAAGVGIWFGSVLRGDHESIVIGARTNIQELCMLHTDPGYPLQVGEGCTIGHRAILHGCTIGDNTLIGMGAIVLNGARVGANCIVGAGALIPENRTIPDGSLVVGLPGKVARELTPEQIAANRVSAENYVTNWQRVRDGMVPV